jgi:hypothetical protein
MEIAGSGIARAAVEVAAAAAADPDLEASACAGKGKASACAGKGKTSAGAGKGKASATAGAGKGKTSARAGKGKASAGARKGKASADSRKQVVQGYSKSRLVQATVWFRFLKEGQGEIDGLHWDDDKLEKEIDGCLRQLKDNPFVYYGGAIDDESFLFLDEQQLTMLNRRLALCRIRAYEVPVIVRTSDMWQFLYVLYHVCSILCLLCFWFFDIGQIPGYGR